MAAVLPATSTPVDILYDYLEGDNVNQDDDLNQGDLYQGGLNPSDYLYHQDDDLYDYYGETAPEISELDWLPHNAIAPTDPSIAAIDAFVQANLDILALDDLTEPSLNSTDSEYGHLNQPTNEANKPHASDDILSWSLRTQDGMFKEDSLETKEDNRSENRAAITDLRSLVLKEFEMLRAKQAANEDQMNKIMAAITKFKTFTDEAPVLNEMLYNDIKRVTQGRKQDK
jgi:hypothetical protein